MRLMQMHANKQKPLKTIEAGDIGAAVGFKQIRTGDTLCSPKHPVVLENITFPDPVIKMAVEPKTQDDVDKLAITLAKLAEEDPTFTINVDSETGQTIISGMGELHLDVILDRLKREFNIDCNKGTPSVAYKEAITNVVQHTETYKKQTGGRGRFAEITFEISPADKDFKGLQFVNEIKVGSISKEYILSVEKGFKSAMSNGVLLGFALENLKVRLLDGAYHSVDSDQIAFETVASLAFKESCKKANPVLLEPIMKLEVVTPEESMGDIIGDLNRRRGQVEGMDDRAGAKVIKAKVPLSEMFGYVTTLRTISSGRASSSMEFSNYSEASKNITEAVIEKVKGKIEA